MNNNLQDLLADNSEVILDSIMNNDIIKEIPIFGSSLKIIREMKSLRDRAYVNKIKFFLDHIGEINHEQKLKIIDNSKKNINSRAKLGDAIFTTIEQSDAKVKVEYTAISFEAYLNDEIEEADLRLMCHIIRNSFSEDLIDIIENEDYKTNLKYVVANGLSVPIYKPLTHNGDIEPKYILSTSAQQLRIAWRKYHKL